MDKEKRDWKTGGTGMRKRSLAVLLILAVCIASLVARGVSEENTTTAVTEPVEHEGVTLMDAQRDYAALIELVSERYPEINIEIEPYRGRNMSAYCKQQIETGIMPDIYSTTQAWDEKYQKENLIDLSRYPVTELYNDARLSEYIVDGGVYLLPFDFTITGFLCNKSLLERNGIAVPQSFEEMKNVTIPALREKGIKVSACLLDLPGSAFNYFFNACAGEFMNLASGRKWRAAFSDLSSDTWASNNEGLKACIEYFQEWIDCGLITYADNSSEYSAVLGEFTEGNTAFLIGTVKQFSQYADGTGDQYVLVPWYSSDGENNTYITSPTRFYGLNKELLEPGNEQKLEDALHVLEVLSTNEGYYAMNGENSTNLCSIKGFELSSDSPYVEAAESANRGYAMNLVYTGWDGFLVPVGEAILSWIKGESTGEEVLEVFDSTKKTLRDSGAAVYATVTEELDTVQAAQLSGQMFMEATGADAALISYNVYNPEINALMENSYGANGSVLPGELTEEYITIFLPTGWYDTLQTLERTGSEIRAMAEAGADTRNTGYHYPYVFMTADGKPLEDDVTYTVVICGHNRSERSTLGLHDTGIVGLDAAKEYLLKVGVVSSETLDDSLVQYIGRAGE